MTILTALANLLRLVFAGLPEIFTWAIAMIYKLGSVVAALRFLKEEFGLLVAVTA